MQHTHKEPAKTGGGRFTLPIRSFFFKVLQCSNRKCDFFVPRDWLFRLLAVPMWGLLGLFSRDITYIHTSAVFYAALRHRVWKRLKAPVRGVSLLVFHQLHHLSAPICRIYCSVTIPKFNNHPYAHTHAHAECMINNMEHKEATAIYAWRRCSVLTRGIKSPAAAAGIWAF